MLRFRNRGYAIDFDLKDYGFRDYVVVCTYKYVKNLDKYSLTMEIEKKDIGDKYKISSQGIDTQYITSSKETIKSDIGRIVTQACTSGFFDSYIEVYEYTSNCFDRGNDSFEQERMEMLSKGGDA